MLFSSLQAKWLSSSELALDLLETCSPLPDQLRASPTFLLLLPASHQSGSGTSGPGFPPCQQSCSRSSTRLPKNKSRLAWICDASKVCVTLAAHVISHSKSQVLDRVTHTHSSPSPEAKARGLEICLLQSWFKTSLAQIARLCLKTK